MAAHVLVYFESILYPSLFIRSGFPLGHMRVYVFLLPVLNCYVCAAYCWGVGVGDNTL